MPIRQITLLLLPIPTQFKLEFAALDPITIACQMVETICMAGELADLNKFITAFNTHTDKSGFNEISLLHYFKKSLNPKLITSSPHSPCLTTLQTTSNVQLSCRIHGRHANTRRPFDVPVAGLRLQYWYLGLLQLSKLWPLTWESP